MRILALNPFHGGSHRSFLDGWINNSRHDFTVLSLPPRKWKWRMRHAAVTFAEEVRHRTHGEQAWDVVFCTDMLNLAEFRGLCPRHVSELPMVTYFHENQLTYPNRDGGDLTDVDATEPDLHFVFTNFITALAADRVWFNSAFHRDEFLTHMTDMLRRMPDHQPVEAITGIADRCEVQWPGVDVAEKTRDKDSPGPLRILWAARWEHDKDPQTFFAALDLFEQQGGDFRLNVLGGRITPTTPGCFPAARDQFGDRIDNFGFVDSLNEYRRVLHSCDAVVSTAKHEFFGMAVLEAACAGCVPLVPETLAYPEVLTGQCTRFHDGTPGNIAAQLDKLRKNRPARQTRVADQEHYAGLYAWPIRARAMDDAIQSLA